MAKKTILNMVAIVEFSPINYKYNSAVVNERFVIIIPYTAPPPPPFGQWPHLRCDVGLEEWGILTELSASILYTAMVHDDTSSSYKSVD